MEKIVEYILNRLGVIGNHTINRCEADHGKYQELEVIADKMVKKSERVKDAING